MGFGPTLTLGDVTLRSFDVSEAPIFLEFFRNPEVTLYLGHRTIPSLEEEEAWIRERTANTTELGWGIEYDGQLVGVLGGHFKPDFTSCEIGTWIGRPELWNKGILKAAGQLAGEYLFDNYPLVKIMAGFIEGNAASQRIQERAGFVEVARIPFEFFRKGEWRDRVWMMLTRERWEQLQQAAQ